MQNCYACDVGDFGKYGLLKYLCTSGEGDEKSVLNLGVVWYLVPDENHFLFNWDKISEKDTEKLDKYIEQNFYHDWVKTEQIRKIDNGKTIILSSQKIFISLTLNDEKNKIVIKIDDVITDEFIVKMEGGKLNIYYQNNDGKYTDYLKANSENEKFKKCDPKLYEKLADILDKERTILQIQKNNILPPSTSFYDKSLTFAEIPSNGPKARDMRLKKRREWLQEAFKKTEMCDVVFFDPDNGLEIKSIKSHNKYGPKYAFFDELSPYLQRNQSLVIYQHIGRNASAKKQIDDRFKELKKHLNSSSSAFALHYHRGTSRVFFIVPAKDPKIILLEKANRFVEGPWKDHFTLMTQ
jgi:hypothetical protein